MTAVASVGANMHDNNMATTIHGVALPSLQPTLNMKTTPTSIFKKSFEALAKVSAPINGDDADDDDDDEDDDGEDDDDDDFDICDDNSFNPVGNMVASNRMGSFYDPPHHPSHLSNVATPNINPHSGIVTVGSGLEAMSSSLGVIGDIDDDDDFSDHDSHYSADFEDTDPFLVQFPSLIASLPRRSQSPDVAKQLLDFAETINCDIKKFFGRKPGEEDSCDIYEDKWVSSKSGRELYYADLLRIAHGESIETKCKPIKNSSSPSSSSYAATPSTSKERCRVALSADNKDKFSGRVNKSLGLGPLNELFEYGLRGFLSVNKSRSSAKKFKRLKLDIKKHEDVVPMNRRKLPDSFWKQPGCIVATSSFKSKQPTLSSASNCVDNLINSKTLDFSDLLESWTGEERGDFNGDISCSDVSTTSSE